jgi:endonuclease/exonuclease/phosphatase (EEP) superfamily protein YafD
VLLASVHLTSHKDKLTPIQVQQILDFVGDQPAIIAGDFNASPNKAAIQRIIDRGTFQARLSGIDYIFVPKGWELIEHQVIENDLSNHPLVLSTYHIPLTDKSDFSD